MFDSDDDAEYQLVPLGKGTTGLGANDSEKAIREYTRRAQQAWRQNKLMQAKERAFEAERLNAMLENEAKERKANRLQAMELKSLLADKMLTQRKDQERELQAQIDKRRQDYAAQILKDRTEAKVRRTKALQDRRIHHERELLARKKLFEIERRLWKRDREEQEQQRQENVLELKRRAAIGRKQMYVSVETTVQVKRDMARQDKAVQKRKENIQKRRMKNAQETLSTDIKELVEAQKKRQVQLEERRDEELQKQRDAWRKEANGIAQTIKERREADFEFVKEYHNREFQREQTLRMQRQGFFVSNLFHGASMPPHRPMTAPSGRPNPSRAAASSPAKGDDAGMHYGATQSPGLVSRGSPKAVSPGMGPRK